MDAAAEAFRIIDHFPYLSDPKLAEVSLPELDYRLASFVECMRLILFIFIVSISMTISQLASGSVNIFLDVLFNFDWYFVQLVPMITANEN